MASPPSDASIKPLSTLSSFSIQESTARESRNVKGSVVSSGRKLMRLVPTDGDTRLAIAVKEFPRDGSVGFLDRFNFVKLTFKDSSGKQQHVLANINSIATRLHLSSSEIRAAAKEGRLDQLLMNAHKQTSTIVKSYDSLTANLENYAKAAGNKAAKLSEQTIFKVVMEASKLGDISRGVHIANPHHKFIAYKDNDQVRLVVVQKLLGRGSFGQAYNIFSLHNSEEMVLKKANSAQRHVYAQAIKDVKNEYHVLDFIHKKEGGAWGIQDKPMKFVEITTSKRDNDAIGFIGKKYQGDYSDLLKGTRLNQKTPQARLESQLLDCHQLLSGLRHLSSNDIFHGDIKPGNILMRQDLQSGEYLLHIADLGGAQILKEDRLRNATFTPSYTSPEDIKELDAITEELRELDQLYKGQKMIPQEAVDHINYLLIEKEKLAKKMDVFSMGCVLYKAFNPDPKQGPYRIAESTIPGYEGGKFPQVRGEFNKLPNDVPPEISNLIKSMVDPDPTKRPTAEQAFEQLNMLINEKHPELAEKIQVMQNPK